MSTLHWGIKASFLRYLSEMSDGSVEAVPPASFDDGKGAFPSAPAQSPGILRFRGGIRFTGHGGLLNLTVDSPALEQRGEDWVITISDPYAPATRIDLATVGEFSPAASGAEPRNPEVRIGTGVALTAAGADLFFGPYVEGTALDEFTIVGSPDAG
ncbi:HtaA domain-containing protein [Leucobacter sp. W1038]|uniref:HtaA domain-containing protein n=1 Tax=Leucobacter sp. W1038 TaxID=3438281 RepID=UPI003D984975